MLLKKEYKYYIFIVPTIDRLKIKKNKNRKERN